MTKSSSHGLPSAQSVEDEILAAPEVVTAHESFAQASEAFLHSKHALAVSTNAGAASRLELLASVLRDVDRIEDAGIRLLEAMHAAAARLAREQRGDVAPKFDYLAATVTRTQRCSDAERALLRGLEGELRARCA